MKKTCSPGLDREERDSYALVVTATDNGSPQRLSSKVEVVVNVLDVNDNPPRFGQRHYGASVLENASVGLDLIVAQATDIDQGDNGKLR